MLDRDKVISQAYHDCMKEMYAKAQPSADFDQIIENYKNGTYAKDERVYDRHYLSCEEFSYIIDKYVDAYRIKSEWKSHMELVEDYIKVQGTKDVYKEAYTDSKGNWHPGTRNYEIVPSIKRQFIKYLKDNRSLNEEDAVKLAEDMSNIVYETVDNCKNFYSFHREESSFRGSVALGCSPTSNKKTVIDYWKSQGVDLEIVDKNPLLLWEYDHYGDEMDEVMRDEYGDDWEEFWWKQYEEKEKEKALEREKWMAEWKKANNDDSLAQNLQEE